MAYQNNNHLVLFWNIGEKKNVGKEKKNEKKKNTRN